MKELIGCLFNKNKNTDLDNVLANIYQDQENKKQKFFNNKEYGSYSIRECATIMLFSQGEHKEMIYEHLYNVKTYKNTIFRKEDFKKSINELIFKTGNKNFKEFLNFCKKPEVYDAFKSCLGTKRFRKYLTKRGVEKSIPDFKH